MQVENNIQYELQAELKGRVLLLLYMLLINCKLPGNIYFGIIYHKKDNL